MSAPKLSNQTQHYGRLGHDVQRPRRPDPDDVIYLEGVPLEGDEQRLAARAALLSLSHSFASLCGDERASSILEKCLRLGLLPSTDPEESSEVYETLQTCLKSVEGYAEFIAINRYGSHVLSTLFSVMAPLLPSLPATSVTSVISITSTLKGSLLELTQHISGSHVLRSLLCLLAGVSEKDVLPPKGKKGKKRKTENVSASYPRNVTVHSSPSLFKSSFDDIISTIVNRSSRKEKGFMQYLACHEGASKVLMCGLRVGGCAYGSGVVSVCVTDSNETGRTLNLTSLDFPKLNSGSVLAAMAAAILGLDDAETSREIVYGLSGEVSGSWVLEAIMEVCGPVIFDGIFLGAQGRLKEYVEDDVANFVAQSLMAHCRDKSTADKIVKEVLPMIKNGRILKADRSGVLMRAVQMCGRFEVGQELIYNAIFAETNVAELVDVVIEERVTINVNGARVILYMLSSFDKVWAAKVYKALAAVLNPGQIVELCKDGMGSKLLIDGMLTTKYDDLRGEATGMVYDAVKPGALDIATDRVGHWALEKCFRNFGIEMKMEIAMALASGERRLEGSKVGQGVLERLCVKQFLEGMEVFEEAVKKRERAKDGGKEEIVKGFMDDVVKGDGGDGDGGEGGEGGKKKKRKRKKRAGGEERGEDLIAAAKKKAVEL
ncbi:hypothetical protein TrVE_jg2629 [Triparma verrucosa]|uniref:Uncharacterized protein n=1 Tax=Triparma verrucosa TaxID=1606542 RepID=A0A9W7BAY9_9STRA|nr:hypothetical protein TrVE_jg2629 [Triparma verrucosa]